MSNEIEAKMKVEDFGLIRRKLEQAGAHEKGIAFQDNIFFDTEDGSLKAADKGLRLRTVRRLSGGEEKYVITMKGPQQKSELKSREEIELDVADPKTAGELFEALGFKRQLSFEKRRESWELSGCKIELDTVPILGLYVEIEGPDEGAVMAMRKTLAMESNPLIKTSYIAMLARHLKERGIEERRIRL